MVEAHVTTVPFVSSSRKTLRREKGSVPKVAEACGCPGNSDNIRFTVAYCGELSNGSKPHTDLFLGGFWDFAVADS